MDGILFEGFVFPDTKKWHRCLVVIFDTKEHMLNFCEDSKIVADPEQAATCTTWTDSNRRDFGVMLFHKGEFTQEIIVHECGHAAFGYIRKKKNVFKDIITLLNRSKAVTSEEEMFCHALGRMADQLSAIYQDHIK